MPEPELKDIYYVDGDPHCRECAEIYTCGVLPEPQKFDDVYDGAPGGIHCASCLESLGG